MPSNPREIKRRVEAHDAGSELPRAAPQRPVKKLPQTHHPQARVRDRIVRDVKGLRSLSPKISEHVSCFGVPARQLVRVKDSFLNALKAWSTGIGLVRPAKPPRPDQQPLGHIDGGLGVEDQPVRRIAPRGKLPLRDLAVLVELAGSDSPSPDRYLEV
jgi:hypothetical protein